MRLFLIGYGRNLTVYLLIIAGTVLFLDQLSKVLVVHFLPLHSFKTVIPGFFNLVHFRNTGVAFSFLAGESSVWRLLFFAGMSVVGMGVVLYLYRQYEEKEIWPRTGLALIFGGALGNLVDRMRLGEVIDFLDVYAGNYHWPAFNVADSAITIGASMLLIYILRAR